MMAEMLAALLALSIALGSAAAVVQLSARTGSAQADAARQLVETRRVGAVVDEAIRLHTPASVPTSTLAAGDRLEFACGDRGMNLCQLSVAGTAGARRLVLSVDGMVVQAAPLGSDGASLMANISVSPPGAPGRLMQGLTVLEGEARAKPIVSVTLPDEAPVDCRYDPGSYACAPGGA